MFIYQYKIQTKDLTTKQSRRKCFLLPCLHIFSGLWNIVLLCFKNRSKIKLIKLNFYIVVKIRLETIHRLRISLHASRDFNGLSKQRPHTIINIWELNKVSRTEEQFLNSGQSTVTRLKKDLHGCKTNENTNIIKGDNRNTWNLKIQTGHLSTETNVYLTHHILQKYLDVVV